MTSVYPLAKEQWDSAEGCQQLVDHWETYVGKHEAERIISTLIEKCPRRGSVIDLGCGPGRLISWLKDFDSYQGFDWSEHMTAQAQKVWISSERRSFIRRNAFDGAPTRKWADLLLCIDLSRHYVDPLAFLLMVTERWPAHYYIFSVLHGAVEEELINGAVVNTASLDELQSSYGEIVDAVEQPLPGKRLVRYMLIKRPALEHKSFDDVIAEEEIREAAVRVETEKLKKRRGRPRKNP